MKEDNLHNWITKFEKNVTHSWDNHEFIIMTIQQINKDFAPYLISPIEIELNSDFDVKHQLISKVNKALHIIERENVSSIPQLMYIIDIPEKIFQELLLDSDSFFMRLSEVIIIREAYKVWIRLNFS